MRRPTLTTLTLAAIVAAAATALVFGVGNTDTPGTDGIPPVVTTATTGPAACTDTPAADTPAGACTLPTLYHGHPTLDTVDYGTDLPHCASDDWNADHVARCYTVRVTDGAVLILDASDTVIGTLR